MHLMHKLQRLIYTVLLLEKMQEWQMCGPLRGFRVIPRVKTRGGGLSSGVYSLCEFIRDWKG